MRRALDFLFLVIVLSAGCGAPGGPPVKSSPQGECTATFAPTLTPTRTQAPTFTPTHTPTPTPTYTPTHTPTWTPTPTPLVIEARELRGVKFEIAGQVVAVTEITGEQAIQLIQWQRQNDQEWWRWWLSVIGLIGAMLALIFAGWRASSHARQIREQMLASYRERLFTDDPAAIIAAAMSLSKYPREAIWLVMRWAEIHRKNEQILEWNKSRDKSLNRILRSIQDALSNLSKTKSWALFWREIDLKRFHIKKRFFIPYWKKVQGARLEGMTITIEIGPIHLPNAFMQKGVYWGIGLKGAYLFGAHLEGANLSGSHLEGAKLMGANLEGADLEGAHLEGANLFGAHLEGTKMWNANLEGNDLLEAHLENAILEDDFLSYAMNKGAVLDDSQKQRVANWEENHPEAPWLKSVYIWDVYLDDENRRNEIRDEEIRTVWEYINRIRSL